MSAAAALARAEAAGARLRLGPDGRVEVQAAKPLPPDVLADLRRWREDVAHLLALRAAVAAAASVPVVPEPDPIEQAEREAVRSMPSLPPEGSAERERLDAKQAEMVRGLLAAAAQRPPCFPGKASRPPPPGSHCSCCAGRRWWVPTNPKADGTGPSAHWRCATCRPPAFPKPRS